MRAFAGEVGTEKTGTTVGSSPNFQLEPGVSPKLVEGKRELEGPRGEAPWRAKKPSERLSCLNVKNATSSEKRAQRPGLPVRGGEGNASTASD